VLIHCLDSLRSIDNGGQGFKTALVLLLGRDMPLGSGHVCVKLPPLELMAR
jgi:hypothetical protein